MRSKCVFCFGTIFFLIQVALAQEWSAIANPSPRHASSMIYDAKNERMVMFGGGNIRLPWGRVYNDVWALNLEPNHDVWQFLTPSGIPPSPRQFSSAVYDSSVQRMILFGGTNDWADYFNDVWMLTLEPGHERWEEIRTSGISPSPRCGASAIYDPVGRRMIIFGGKNRDLFLNDVWSLDLVNFVWQPIAPTGTPPQPRNTASAIYDPFESRMIVFGGKSEIGMFNDVWTLDLIIGNETWTELSVSGELPLAVGGHVAGYDCPTRRMYIFGGYNYPPFTYPEDIFFLDLNILEWTRVTLHPAPPGRRDLCGSFDHRNRRLIIFGGSRYYDYYFGDTYAFTVSVSVCEDCDGDRRYLLDRILPKSFSLSQNYPNPFRNSTSICYACPVNESRSRVHVLLKVYDSTGSLVRTLVDEDKRPGYYSAEWDCRDSFGRRVGAGVYFYTIEAQTGQGTQEFLSTKKMIVLR